MCKKKCDKAPQDMCDKCLLEYLNEMEEYYNRLLDSSLRRGVEEDKLIEHKE